jgi:hypothetical protein
MVGSYTDDLAREVATQAVCGTVKSLLAQGCRPVQGSKRTDRRQRSTEQAAEVVSSDEIRKEQSPDGETPGDQSGIFHRVRAQSSRVLGAGHDVIVDSIHIDAEHRLRQLSIAPPDLKIRYVIIDRPLVEKQRDAGWRAGRGPIEKYDRLFAAQVGGALDGDGRPNIQVLDLRSNALVEG